MFSFVNHWPCLIQSDWKRSEQIRRKLGKQRIRRLLHRKANRLSEYVEIHAVMKIYVGVGFLNASYRSWVLRQDGHSAREDISRRLRARTTTISIRYQWPSNWNSDSSGFGRRVKQKGGNGVLLLTEARFRGNSCWMGEKTAWLCFNFVFFYFVFGKSRGCVLILCTRCRGPRIGPTGFVHCVPSSLLSDSDLILETWVRFPCLLRGPARYNIVTVV